MPQCRPRFTRGFSEGQGWLITPNKALEYLEIPTLAHLQVDISSMFHRENGGCPLGWYP